jgi:hypothetical protein
VSVIKKLKAKHCTSTVGIISSSRDQERVLRMPRSRSPPSPLTSQIMQRILLATTMLTATSKNMMMMMMKKKKKKNLLPMLFQNIGSQRRLASRQK